MATLIRTPQDLDNIRNNLSGSYELVNDIDMSAWGNWTPINEFAGTIDGNGYLIQNLSIVGNTSIGLIGTTYQPFTARNLGFENLSINGEGYNAGSLVGNTRGSGTIIENVYVKGGSIISRGYAGGLIGNLRGSATIKNSYAILDLIHTTQYHSSGFIGAFVGDAHIVENCYSVTTNLTSVDPTEVNGFSYNPNNSSITGVYWDKEISGVTQSHGGEGKATSEMKQQSTYPTYEFTTVWGMNGDYPYLQVFGAPVVPPKTVSMQVNSYVIAFSSHTERFVATLRNIESYSLPIRSNVTTSVKTGKNEIRDVSSFINPIYSNSSSEIYRQPLSVTRNIVSHLKPIQARTDVLLHVKSIPILASVSVLENPSMSFYMENQSNISHIKNPSYCEVVK